VNHLPSMQGTREGVPWRSSFLWGQGKRVNGAGGEAISQMITSGPQSACAGFLISGRQRNQRCNKRGKSKAEAQSNQGWGVGGWWGGGW